MAGDAGNVRMSGFAVRTYGALDDALFFAGNGPVDGGKIGRKKAVTQSFVDFANGRVRFGKTVLHQRHSSR